MPSISIQRSFSYSLGMMQHTKVYGPVFRIQSFQVRIRILPWNNTSVKKRLKVLPSVDIIIFEKLFTGTGLQLTCKIVAIIVSILLIHQKRRMDYRS
jgi:hypothetical protein